MRPGKEPEGTLEVMVITFFDFFYFICLNVLPAYMSCAPCACLVPTKARKDVGSPETEGVDYCKSWGSGHSIQVL